MNLGIEVISPQDEHYGDVTAAVNNTANKRAKPLDHNKLAKKYNKAEIGSVIVVTLPSNYRVGNLVRVLIGRGLVEEVDFHAVRLSCDKDGNSIQGEARPITLTKLSDAAMRTI